jgi:hypothetical protein
VAVTAAGAGLADTQEQQQTKQASKQITTPAAVAVHNDLGGSIRRLGVDAPASECAVAAREGFYSASSTGNAAAAAAMTATAAARAQGLEELLPSGDGENNDDGHTEHTEAGSDAREDGEEEGGREATEAGGGGEKVGVGADARDEDEGSTEETEVGSDAETEETGNTCLPTDVEEEVEDGIDCMEVRGCFGVILHQ